MSLITPDFFKHVAVITFLLILFIFLLKPKTKDYNRACIKDFEVLKLQILACTNVAECIKTEKDIERFWERYYKRIQPPFLNPRYSILIRELTYKKDHIMFGKGPAFVDSNRIS